MLNRGRREAGGDVHTHVADTYIWNLPTLAGCEMLVCLLNV